MKIRSGFVSNSSSSSYIIALRKTNKPCPHCGRSDPDFLDMIEDANERNDDNNVSLIYTKDYQFPEPKTKLNEEIAKYLNQEDKWEVAEISISYHDEALRRIFDNLRKSNNLVIIYDFDG